MTVIFFLILATPPTVRELNSETEIAFFFVGEMKIFSPVNIVQGNLLALY